MTTDTGPALDLRRQIAELMGPTHHLGWRAVTLGLCSAGATEPPAERGDATRLFSLVMGVDLDAGS